MVGRSYNVEATKVYNFEIADNHTYFVGEEGVLVHNYLAGGPGFWPNNSEWENSVLEFLGLSEPINQGAANAASDPKGTAASIASILVANDCKPGVTCSTMPGIGGLGKGASYLSSKGGEVLKNQIAKILQSRNVDPATVERIRNGINRVANRYAPGYAPENTASLEKFQAATRQVIEDALKYAKK